MVYICTIARINARNIHTRLSMQEAGTMLPFAVIDNQADSIAAALSAFAPETTAS